MSKRSHSVLASTVPQLTPLQPGRNVVYVYGSLRQGPPCKVYQVPGHLYDCGSFPGVRRLLPHVEQFVLCERIVVDDDRLIALDRYEGYKPDDPKHSLFKRERLYDGWIYVWNGTLADKTRVISGDWLRYGMENPTKVVLSPKHLQGSNVFSEAAPQDTQTQLLLPPPDAYTPSQDNDFGSNPVGFAVPSPAPDPEVKVEVETVVEDAIVEEIDELPSLKVLDDYSEGAR